MTSELQKYKEEEEILRKVNDHFKDWGKTYQWYRLGNPQFGEVSPERMVKVGKGQKVLAFVESASAASMAEESY